MPNPTIEPPETLREFAPHALSADAVARQLGTSPVGLSLEEARLFGSPCGQGEP